MFETFATIIFAGILGGEVGASYGLNTFCCAAVGAGLSLAYLDNCTVTTKALLMQGWRGLAD